MPTAREKFEEWKKQREKLRSSLKEQEQKERDERIAKAQTPRRLFYLKEGEAELRRVINEIVEKGYEIVDIEQKDQDWIELIYNLTEERPSYEIANKEHAVNLTQSNSGGYVYKSEQNAIKFVMEDESWYLLEMYD